MTLRDDLDRQRFVTESEANFSVIAPAGVGKTTAITRRLAKLVAQDDARQEPIVPSLVVVTYTRKAAEEMRLRTAREVRELPHGTDLAERLGQAFFGTIHSFCLELLQRFGPLLGWPARLELASRETLDALWLRFVRSRDDILPHLPHRREEIERQLRTAEAASVGRWLPPSLQATVEDPGPCPKIELEPLFNYLPKDGRCLNGVTTFQNELKDWQRRMEEGLLGDPPSYKKKDNTFFELVRSTFAPLWSWRETTARSVAQNLADGFLQVRLERGCLSYDDMVLLAAHLVRHPVAGPRIRAQGYRIILDEAQDTDRDQFRVLVGAASSGASEGNGLDVNNLEPGRFCMVGDPQQAIYSDRADLPSYTQLHHDLVASGHGEELRFTVTMRCPHAVVAAANQVFPPVLAAQPAPDVQVDYVPLAARDDAAVGEIERWAVSAEAYGDKPNIATLAKAEANLIVAELSQRQLDGLGISDWSELAVLLPRNDDIDALSIALRTAGLDAQVHSGNEPPLASPARAWFLAGLQVLHRPDNAWEIAGLLREAAGLSDAAIAAYRGLPRSSRRRPLTLREPPRGRGEVVDALAQWHQLWRASQGQPLTQSGALLVDDYDLRGRLAALQPFYGEDFNATLDDLLEDLAGCERDGLSLGEAIERLTGNAAVVRAEIHPRPGAIQLLTTFKAKGLEWPAVILAGLFRELSVGGRNYPRLVNFGGDEAVRILLTKDDDLAQREHHRARLRHQRLWYVGFTRAKHRLILIDNAAAGAREANTLAEAALLFPHQPNHEWWQSLPATGHSAGTAAPPKESPSKHGKLLPTREMPALTASPKALGPRRVLPSSLALGHKPTGKAAKATEAALPGLESALSFGDVDALTASPSASQEPGQRDLHDLGLALERAPAPIPGSTAYGNWWHLTMEQAPWVEGLSAVRAHAEKALLHCPDPARGQAELGAFLATTLASTLTTPGTVVRGEVPLLWRDRGDVYDGFIDCVAAREDLVRVIDWKTDRLPPREITRRYAPQVKVYARALARMLKLPVEPTLYSTLHACILPLPLSRP